ncbi:unnamed protein product, partial [Prorocentrum cordatum]
RRPVLPICLRRRRPPSLRTRTTTAIGAGGKSWRGSRNRRRKSWRGRRSRRRRRATPPAPAKEEEELARKKKQEAGLTEEETAEELENLLYRLELQKVSLETTGHQKHTLDDKAMGAEGQKNADDFVLPDVRSLIESLNQQNNRLESQFQGHLLRECDYEADSELLALEDKVEEASTEEQQPLNIQLVEGARQRRSNTPRRRRGRRRMKTRSRRISIVRLNTTMMP